jgi:UDP-glucose 4-epimerase
MTSKVTVKWDSDEVCMVTGGAGFIGSHLVRELANQGKQVVVYDMTPDASYIADVMDRVTFVYGDVADAPHLMGVIAEHGVKVIFHLGYMLVPDTHERMGWAIRSNCLGFHAVMEAARILRVRRVMWASSQSVYGRADLYPPVPVSEDVVPNPTLVYGACKLFNEHVARFYRNEHDLDNIGYRKSVAFGLGKSRLRDYSIAHLLVENAILGRPVEMPPVDYHANWLYVKDIVRAYLLGGQSPRPEHMIFNIGGFVHRCSEVIEILKRVVPEVTVLRQEGYILSHPIEVYDQDQSRAKEELGYEPVYTLEKAVKDYIKTIEELGDQYESAWSAYEVTPLP